ncbi:MAG TPA: hypothetical protein VFA04_21835 [Bryobacteraceae bacterium]|nr:hypothetical protein [Bryobacteraceae bacterium]
MKTYNQSARKMKIAGSALLVTGAIFDLLFMLAKVGGVFVSPTAFVIASAFLISGVRALALVKAAQTKLAAGSRPQEAGAASAETGASIPMPPQMTALIDAELARQRRVILWIGGGFVAVFLLGGVSVHAALPGPDGAVASELVSSIGLFGAALIGVLWMVFGQRTLRRDRSSGSYCRSAGAITVAAVPGGYLLRVGEQVLLTNNHRAMKVLRSMPAATVDYSPHAHIIFQVYDAFGHSVYRFGDS